MKKKHKTHFPQIGEVENMGALLPLSPFIKFFTILVMLSFLLNEKMVRKGRKRREIF